jgi:hypothetical protein
MTERSDCNPIEEKRIECSNDSDNSKSIFEVKKRCSEDNWILYNHRTRVIQEKAQSWAVLGLTVISLVLCLVFFIFCKPCMLGILLLSACLCPFYHSMNAPLWLAILLLAVGGWSFTTGALTVSWSGQTF